jgi:NADH dehydrogenase
VTTDTGETYTGDYLVLAAGSQPSFFGTPGAEHAFPLYSLDDAEALSTRIVQSFEEADRDPERADDGAIDFVVVGGGPTGVEVAGALSEMINTTMVHEYPALAPRAKVHLVDHGHELLKMFADKGHAYTARILEKDGVELRMGSGVAEIGPGHVTLSDGSTIRTRCVIWDGGLKAAPIAATSRLPQGHGGRIDVESDFSVAGFPGVFVIGDIANIPAKDGKTHPQLGSVALQSGSAAANTILAELHGAKSKPFSYLDKGTMAMIGRGAAIAQVRGVELHGKLAFAAWLGVHAALITGGSNRGGAFKSWAVDYFGKERAPEALDRSGTPRMAWEEDDVETAAAV